MGAKYNSLEELQRKKELLKAEVSDLQDLLTFKKPKESLSAMTHGFTDRFIDEVSDGHGGLKIHVKKNQIVKDVSTGIKDSVLNRNAIYGMAKSDTGFHLLENTLKIAAVTMVGNYAKKNMKSSSWKKKAVGLAVIYLAPIALRFVRKKLEEYQKTKTTSSFEQLI